MDTRKSLEEEVLSWLDESGDTVTTRTNVRNALAQAHLQRVTQTDWPFLMWPEPQTFNLVVGQRNYVLHQEYGRPFYFRDVDQSKDLVEIPFRNYKPSFTDEKYKFVLWNRSPVAAHPSSASKLTFVSDDADDSGTSKGIYLRGMTASGVRTETINPTGLSSVDSVHTYLPSGIVTLSKFGTWEGNLTVTANSGVVAVVTLSPDEIARSYQQIRMLWEPDDADEIEYNFFRTPTPLDADYAIPDIPYPFSRVLVWDALVLLAAYDGRIDSNRKDLWRQNQQAIDTSMRQTFLDGQSLGAEAPGVHYIDED